MTKTVEAVLRITGKDNTGAMAKSVASKLDFINKRADALNRQQSALARGSQAAFGTIMRYAAPAALALGAKAALMDFAALDRQMTRIGNTAGSTAEETRAAFDVMQQQSKDLAMPLENAVTALDTLVSSGMDLKEAMAFLPSVLATTQASGASVVDIANTGLKASSALKISSNQMQRAFDLMVSSGQSGQFELKDMALYIPTLANSFARMGYTGEDGLKRLMAALQTVREDSGTAEEAANDVANVFQKMGSSETISNFKKFGINLTEEMAKAKVAGEDTLNAFIRLSNQAVKGDLTKLPRLFSDRQVLDGMTSLITSTDRLTHYYDVLGSKTIDGTVARNNIRILNDTQASVDRLSNSWQKLTTSAGEAVSKFAVPAMDSVSKDLDYGTAMRSGLQNRGMGFGSRESWIAMHLPLGAFSHSDAADKAAFEGGYKDPKFLNDYKAKNWPDEGERRGHGGMISAPQAAQPLPGFDAVRNFFRLPSKEEFKDAMKIDLRPEADEASKSIADGGIKAGDAIKEGAAALVSAGQTIMDAAKSIGAAGARASSVGSYNGTNADRGRTMSPDVIDGYRGGGGGF